MCPCRVRDALAGAIEAQEEDAEVEEEDVLVHGDDSVNLDAVDGVGEGGDQGDGSEDDEEAQRAAFEAVKAEKEAIKQVRNERKRNHLCVQEEPAVACEILRVLPVWRFCICVIPSFGFSTPL